MKLDRAALYHQLGALIGTLPDLMNNWTSDESRRWLGRAAVLVEAGGDLIDSIKLRSAGDHLGGVTHAQNVQAIVAVVHRAFARAEIAAPISAQGAFLPMAEPFTAISAFSKVFEEASSSVLMVDPYADVNLLSHFALLVPEGAQVRVLTDKADYKPALKPAAERWVEQYGDLRPLQVRLAPPRTLHDRLIVVDDRALWLVGQSFNALGKRRPPVSAGLSPN